MQPVRAGEETSVIGSDGGDFSGLPGGGSGHRLQFFVQPDGFDAGFGRFPAGFPTADDGGAAGWITVIWGDFSHDGRIDFPGNCVYKIEAVFFIDCISRTIFPGFWHLSRECGAGSLWISCWVSVCMAVA